MPFPFPLPTTSSVSLSTFFVSPTHPSLPHAATTRRSILKDALKRHKRLAAPARGAHLAALRDAVIDYIPYLLALNTAAAYRDVGLERVDVEVLQPLEVEWRTILSATLPGREAPRQKLIGIHHELAFTLVTLASVHTLLARSLLKSFRDSTSATSDQRTTAVTSAMKHLLEAHSIYAHLLTIPTISAAAAAKDTPPDIQPSTISALASLALAEATVIVVSKDDPYAAAAADDRNAAVTDWMFKAPSIPKVRAHLFARICLAAAEHAGQAHALLARSSGASSDKGRIDDDLVRYAADLRRTARGKAIRFLAIDAELAGKTGEALAWLRGARGELGFASTAGDDKVDESGRRKGFRGLKQSWQERREDRRLERGGEDWGLDAGRFEELRVVEMLAAKWERENSTVNVQLVPPSEPLLAQHLPTGREYHSPLLPYRPPTLDAETLVLMRVPLEPGDRGVFRGEEEDSGGEAGFTAVGAPPGAFPGEGSGYPAAATAGGAVASGSNYY